MHWHHILCMQGTDNIYSKLNWLVWMCGHWVMFVLSVHTVWLRSTEHLLSYHMMCELGQPAQMHESTCSRHHPGIPPCPFLQSRFLRIQFTWNVRYDITERWDIRSSRVQLVLCVHAHIAGSRSYYQYRVLHTYNISKINNQQFNYSRVFCSILCKGFM